MIETYKITSGLYDDEIPLPIKMVTQKNKKTRGNTKALKKTIVRDTKPIRKNFFSNRIVNFWNELLNEVVEAPSIKSFERRLDKFWSRYSIKYNFERCIQFEKQKMSGIGTIKMIDLDLEPQAD